MMTTVHELLYEFADKVKTKQYKKMPYEQWRGLREASDRIVSIEMECSYNNPSETDTTRMFLESVKGDYVYEGYCRDGSFGSYLYDVYTKQFTSSLTSACNKMKDSFATLAETAKSATASLNTTIPSLTEYAVADLNSVRNNYENAYGWCTGTNTIELNGDCVKINGKTVEEMIDEAMGNSITNERKENETMTNLFKGLTFGSCENDNVKMSMYGVAVKNANGSWVSYDKGSDQIVDVDILNFSAKYLYKMPVAIKDIAAGDVIIHNRKPMFVEDVQDGRIIAIDPADGEEKAILPTTNMFGFNFATKVVNLFGDLSAGVSADSPFGNTLPLMMLADGKSDDMLPLLFMMNGGKMDMSNPMMMYFLMNNGKAGNDMLPFLMMSNFQNSNGKCSCKK